MFSMSDVQRRVLLLVELAFKTCRYLAVHRIVKNLDCGRCVVIPGPVKKIARIVFKTVFRCDALTPL
jgi:hypothetical protein